MIENTAAVYLVLKQQKKRKNHIHGGKNFSFYTRHCIFACTNYPPTLQKMVTFRSLPIYGKIIYITCVVYLFTQVWKLFCLLCCLSGYDWTQYLALPAKLESFWARPWSLLTYFFCHADLSQDPFHLIFNMLWLWWFGEFFMRDHTDRQFLAFYLCAGMAVGVFFLLCYNIFPYFRIDRLFAYVVGASGAIFALVTSVAMRRPNESLGLNLFVRVVWVKMKWLAVAVIAFGLLCRPDSNIGGLICHLGGVLFGLWYGWRERQGVDITAYPQRLLVRLQDWWQHRKQPTMRATRGGYTDPIGADRRKDMDYNKTKRDEEACIDAILDKISKHGYDGLTTEEKNRLFNASRRKQQQP